MKAAVRAEHFELLANHQVRHRPTGAVLAFPLNTPRPDGAPLCEIHGGAVGDDGSNYALLDMIAQARQFLLAQSFKKSAKG